MNKLPVTASGAGNVTYNLSFVSVGSKQTREFEEACRPWSSAHLALKKRDPVTHKIKLKTGP